MKNSKFSWFGIDFGTTNSAAFSFTGTNSDNISPIPYGDDEGRPFPSVVAINKETGEIITGREAKDRRNTLIETHEYFSSIKSIIDSNKKWIIAGREWTAEEITSEIFKSLAERVKRNNANIVEEAVVAVPVGFSDKKKVHLRRAAQKAGIKIRMFISEPTAAFCSNYNELKSCKNVVVFDWGGGTLDVAVLKIDNGRIQELSTEGMNVAGNHIDRKLAEKMHAKFMRSKTPAVSFEEMDATIKDQLIMKCEKAKCDFCDDDIVSVSINRYGGYGSVRDTMNYDFFSLLLEEEVEEAINCLKRAIKKANLNTANIDRILCVGGSSRLRPLREKIEENYKEDLIYYPDEVMWDIAKGAAIISTRPGKYSLNKSIGIILSDGSYLPLLNEGQQIPCEEMHLTLGTVEGSSKEVKEARFIFTDSENPLKRSFVEHFVFPLRGFVDEYISLSCYIDPDFIFKLKLVSNRMHENSSKVWSYDKLKICYQIEEG
jgi:molecular chaperone DnaK